MEVIIGVITHRVKVTDEVPTEVEIFRGVGLLARR
jgi:hypothetical protein